MEAKKTPRADTEQLRTTGFLLGLILVLSVFYVALEWNSEGGDDGVDLMDLSEMTHESELVPMSNVETVSRLVERRRQEPVERLRVVDDEVELTADEEEDDTGGDDDETLAQESADDDEKALASMETGLMDAEDFRVVEDLPQFPGGAVEFMKWLTRNLRYPPKALRNKVEGRVVAVFYVETDGSVTGVKVTQSLSPECDREAVRVLCMMPNWAPGMRKGEPCRTKVQLPIVFKR